MNLLAFAALNKMAVRDLREFDSCLTELNKSNIELSFYKFQSLALLSEESIISYIDFLDLLVSVNELVSSYLNDHLYLNKKAIISSSYEKNFTPRYEQRVLFYAVFTFLNKYKDTLSREELTKWDRLVKNLVINTYYNSSKIFQDSVLEIDRIVNAYSGDIYQTFLTLDIKGFDNQQIKEEKLKIKLLSVSSEWRTLIQKTESHPYLNGQIILLLSFSGIFDRFLDGNIDFRIEALLPYFDKMTIYYKKFDGLFNDWGIRHFENELFRRALLTKGDYRLYSTNFSLLTNGHHRDISWKRFIGETGNRTNTDFKNKCGYLHKLFDDVDCDNIEKSLKLIIKGHNSTGWEKDFIENPVLIKTSYQKYFKFIGNGDIFILRKSKYNKYADPEYKSLLLKEYLLKNGFSESDVELGFIEQLNQYGIIRLKKLKPKIVYNYGGNKKYLVRQKGKDDFYTKSSNEIKKFLLENFSA